MMQMILAGVGLAMGAAGVAAALTAMVRRWAVRTAFVARPQRDRYHQSVVAMGGGVAIFWTLAIFILGGAAAVREKQRGHIAV